MLQIVIPETEMFDPEKEIFFTLEPKQITLEHSLISISKWEAKWKKPFFNYREEKTDAELRSYICCMSVGKTITDSDVNRLTQENVEEIVSYMSDSMTATWFKEIPGQQRRSSSVITSEIVYYWMTVFNIPFECDKWHINRLLTLIRVCGEENNPKKMSKKSILSENSKLNAMRKAKRKMKG